MSATTTGPASPATAAPSLHPIHPQDTAQDAVWDAFVARHAHAHLLQLSGWGALKAAFGWEAELVTAGAGAGGAGSLLLFKRFAGIKVGYAPKGPLTGWQDRAQTGAVLAALEEACRGAGAAVLKLEPDLPDTPAHRALLASYGFRPSTRTVQPRSTVVVDISGGEETVLARMKAKWRYNVRLAERKGVSVRAAGGDDLPAFHELMQATAARDRFDVHDAAYYDAAYDLLAPEHAAFLLAEYEGQPLGAIVVGCVGRTAWYLWGASSDRERNRMPNHALQWAGMRWARERGATRYDLWGIPDEIGALAQGLRGGDGSGTPADELPVDVERFPAHGLWGVYRFKQGFGGDVVRWVGAWDRPVSEPGFRLYQAGLAALDARAAAGRRSAVWRGTEEGAPVPVTEQAEWQRVLAALPEPHVLQSWEWGALKAQTGWQAERFALPGGQGAFQLLTRQPIPYAPLRIGYVPKGPVLDWEDDRAVMEALDAIEAQARRRLCVAVKIDPDVGEDSPAGQRLLARLRRRGWVYSNEQVQFKNTALTDLTAGEDALLEGTKPKWRYNVRLAQKRGIAVRPGAPADLPAFYALYAETGERDGFLIRPFAYYRAIWERFLAAQEEADNPAGGALLLAEHPDEAAPVAGLFLLRYGTRAWYFYGASGERRRRDMPNHLLQWEALRWSQAQGCTAYDWWGAPTHPDDAEDAMQGVWQFKQGFGAQLRVHVGAWDYAPWPPLYTAYARLLPQVIAAMRRGSRK